MPTQNETFLPGFGERLKEERKRLGLSQDEFAERAGVKRLAQLQYEKEAREPRTSYLAAIGAMGVSLSYVIFGKRPAESVLGPEAIRGIEKKIFDQLEAYVAEQCGGYMSSEGRYVLFEVMRSHCIQAASKGLDVESNLAAFFPKRFEGNG
ncbi:helix-turn-helix domain-containing protein [Azovibrio restrictus]|uniref:helix-turn-helix domain-containing protein n=1 Tax=Azovibrio restrictus TaxID=146938 RepID=UPI0012EC73D9|nr:helix-turn-helix transcriptional regulator [Azovibrio restrictus]